MSAIRRLADRSRFRSVRFQRGTHVHDGL